MIATRRVLQHLRTGERKAVSAYGKDAASFRQAGDPKTAKLLTHIKGEERQHSKELRTRLKTVPLSSLRKVR